MTLKDALDRNKGIGPGFHFLRHALSIAIVLFHCREVVYWQHSAELLAAAGVIDAGAAAEAAQYGPVHFTLQEIVRPSFHAMLGMFFGLSGFLVAGSALRTATIGKFFTNRALRIFPALAVETLLSAFILGPLVTVLPLRDYFNNSEFHRYFGNMIGWVYFYLPGVFVHNPLPRVVNGQLWTLPLELCCYIMMLGFLVTGVIRRPRLMLTIGLVGVIAMLGLFFHDPAHFSPKHQNFFAAWYIVVIFWFGTIFFLNAEWVPLKFGIFIACAALYWVTIFFNEFTPLSGILLTYCTVYIGFTKFPWWDRLVKTDYSYGLYLYHFPILQAFMYFLAPHLTNLPLGRQFAIITLLGVPTTLAFAAISWRFIEKPALALRSIFAKTQPVSPDDQLAFNAALLDPIAVGPADGH